MWIARNKDGSFSLSDTRLIRGHLSGTCPTDNNGNLIENYWVCLDGSIPSPLYFNIFPELKWEDEPVEVALVPIMDESSSDAPKLLGPCAVCSNARCLNDRNSCKYSDIYLKDIENNIKPLDSDIAKYVEDNFNELISE